MSRDYKGRLKSIGMCGLFFAFVAFLTHQNPPQKKSSREYLVRS